MKKLQAIWHYFFALLILSLPQIVFAAGTDPTPGKSYTLQDYSTSGFTLKPPPGDLSISYLQDIFGVVDGVLHGTGSQILGNMFGVFNAFALTIAGVVITYILFVSTMNTAHDGKMLGGKWSSIWIPIRAVIGIGALIPKASGYSFIQIFLMWVVVQGVGAADSIWFSAVNYFQRGGILIQRSGTLISQGEANPKLIFTAGSILKSETCMYTMQNALLNVKARPGLPASPVPDFTSSLVARGVPSGMAPPCYKGDARVGCSAEGDSGAAISFPGRISYAGTSLEGACGKVSWDFTKNAKGMADTYGAINYSNTGAYDSRSLAVNQMVLTLQSYAYSLAQAMVPVGVNQTGRKLELFKDARGYVLNNAARDYIAIMRPALNDKSTEERKKAGQYLSAAVGNGWILAGSYYFTLASINKSFKANETKPPVTTFPSSYDANYFKPAALDKLRENISNDVISKCPPPSSGNVVDTLICGDFNDATKNEANGQSNRSGGGYFGNVDFNDKTGKATRTGNIAWWESNYGQGSGGGASTINGPEPDWTKWLNTDITLGNVDFGAWKNVYVPGISEAGLPGVMEKAVNKVIDGFNGIVQGLQGSMFAILKSQSLNTDPILGVSTLGQNILTATEYLWISGAIIVFAATGIVGCPLIGPLANMFANLLVWLVPMLTAIMFTMFVAGAVMAYYIPLIPTIIMLFTALGWFIAVIESMVAGPFVALGLISPEGGHEYFGQAEKSIMLILNLFVRPTLIIFGFISGAMLSHIGLWLFNTALATALTQTTSASYSPLVSGVLSVVAIILIYMTVVLSIINRCFALIHEIPSNVLNWIGGQVRGFGEEHGSQGIESGVTGKMGTVSQGVTSKAEGAHKSAQGAGEGIGTAMLDARGKGKKGPDEGKIGMS